MDGKIVIMIMPIPLMPMTPYASSTYSNSNSLKDEMVTIDRDGLDSKIGNKEKSNDGNGNAEKKYENKYKCKERNKKDKHKGKNKNYI